MTVEFELALAWDIVKVLGGSVIAGLVAYFSIIARLSNVEGKCDIILQFLTNEGMNERLHNQKANRVAGGESN